MPGTRGVAFAGFRNPASKIVDRRTPSPHAQTRTERLFATFRIRRWTVIVLIWFVVDVGHGVGVEPEAHDASANRRGVIRCLIDQLDDDRYIVRSKARRDLRRRIDSADRTTRNRIAEYLAVVIDDPATSFEQRSAAGRLWRMASAKPHQRAPNEASPAQPVIPIGPAYPDLPDEALCGPSRMIATGHDRDGS